MHFVKALKISFLNILRNTRRTIITFIAMAIGSATIICLGGFIEFTFEGLRESTIRTQLGHFQVYKKGYKENYLKDPYKYLIDEPKSLVKDLKQLEEVDTITARLSFSGLITNGNNSFSALFVGIDPKNESSFASYEIIIEGRQLRRNDFNQSVIGSELANALNVEIGDDLTVFTSTVDGMMNAIDLEVVGIAQTGSKEYDKVFVKMPLELMQNTIYTEGVEKILILLNDTKYVERAENQLKNILQKESNKDLYEYANWFELAEFYQGVKNIYSGFFDVFMITVFIIVFFSIYNTISMSIFERTKEIGTLRAIGFFKTDIIKMFLLEGFILGVVGAILGIVLAVIIANIINLSGGIYIAPPPGQSTGYSAEILLVPSVIIKASLIIIITSIISSLYPSIVGAKKNIIGALSNV